MTSAPSTAPQPSPLPSGLAGQRVLVIGASHGIGAAVASSLVAIGAEVHAASRRGLGPEGATVLTLDLDDAAQLGPVAASLGELDHVVVTAAEVLPTPVGASDSAVEQRVALSRLSGALAVARVFGPRVRAGGSIVLTSAIGATRPRAGLSAATASAAGVEGLGRALALELAPVRVNVVRPGATDTPLLRAIAPDDEAIAAMGAALPIGRVVRADEVAAAILALMANSGITGAVLAVDGGGALA